MCCVYEIVLITLIDFRRQPRVLSSHHQVVSLTWSCKICPIQHPLLRLQPILISHFLLNLQNVNDIGNNSQESNMTHPRFHIPAALQNSFSIGNMGETLDHYGQGSQEIADAVDSPAQARSDLENEVEEEDNVMNVGLILVRTFRGLMTNRSSRTFSP